MSIDVTVDGACTSALDPDVFFRPFEPGFNHGATRDRLVAEAKAYCRRCEVRDACLDKAMAGETSLWSRWGIWGGLTPDERQALADGQRSLEWLPTAVDDVPLPAPHEPSPEALNHLAGEPWPHRLPTGGPQDRPTIPTPQEATMTTASPEPVDQATPDQADAVQELVDALRLTVEYVGNDVLPALPGWSWFDALREHAPDVAQRFADQPVHLVRSQDSYEVLADLMRTTEGHHDAQVRAVRKIVAQSALALRQLVDRGDPAGQEPAIIPDSPRTCQACTSGIGHESTDRRRGGTSPKPDTMPPGEDPRAGSPIASSAAAKIRRARAATPDSPAGNGAGGRGGVNRSTELMRQHGVTPRDVRAWGRSNGVDVPGTGTLKAELVERYLREEKGVQL